MRGRTVSADARTEARRRPKDRKQQILVQARDLFVEFGYPNVSMAQIAEKVGITAGALYRHFTNKSDLLEAVVRDSFAGMANVTGRDIREAVSSSAVGAIARPYVAVLWTRETRHLPDDTRAQIRAVMRESTGGYGRLIAAERPELSPAQTDLLAWSVQSVLASPSRYSVRLPSGEHARVLEAAAAAVVGAPLVPVEPSVGSTATGRTNALQPVSRRERLLAAAIRLFAEHGYQETSMADIGAAADVTGPNLYGYFDSKGALLRAAIERGTNALWLDLDSRLSAHSEAWPALCDVVAGYVGLTMHWAGLRAGLTGEGDVDLVSRAAQREYVAEWVALLRRSRPELEEVVARILVHAALTIVDDLARTPHIRRSATFAENVTAVTLAALAGEVNSQ